MNLILEKIVERDHERRQDLIKAIEVAVHNGFAAVANKMFG